MKSRYSLRTKLVVVFIILGLGPLLLMGAFAASAVNATHRQDVATMEVQLLNQKTAEIQKFFSDVSGLFDIHVGYEQTSIINGEDQKFLLDKLVAENPDVLQASFVDMLGQETAENSRVSDAQKYPLQDISQLAAFKIAKDGGHYLGPVQQTLQGPVMFISGPVVNRNNQIIMVIMGEISLNSLVKLVNFASLGSNGYLYLTDQHGTVIASAEPRLKNKNVLQDSWVDGVLKGKRDNGLSSTDDRLNFAGQEVLSAGILIPKVGWGALVEWPKEDAFAVVQNIQSQLLIFLLVTLALVIFLGWLVGLSILQPLTGLAAAAIKIGNGEFDLKLNITTGDELEELGGVFNKMAAGLKRLGELKEEFVFIAAHELRTPVTAIKGYLSMVTGGELGPVAKPISDLLTQVTAANQRLIQLVEDLLQVARNDAGRLNIAIAPVNIVPVVQNVLLELAPLAKEKQQPIFYQPFGSPVPLVLADSDRLKEVLINLVGNAIKYTKQQGQISIRHELLNNTLITHVTDSGIGMTEQERAKLFEKFYRIKNSDTAKIAGTGLGLFIVKQLVEKMNGKIWVNSQKDQGSTFSFSLQLAQSLPVPDSVPKPLLPKL